MKASKAIIGETNIESTIHPRPCRPLNMAAIQTRTDRTTQPNIKIIRSPFVGR